MDHLVNNTQKKKTRDEYKTHSLDVGMSEARFQAISTTWYIIRRLLPFSHVQCPEFRATVHPAWKVIRVRVFANVFFFGRRAR
jgi:hypothetical protein